MLSIFGWMAVVADRRRASGPSRAGLLVAVAGAVLSPVSAQGAPPARGQEAAPSEQLRDREISLRLAIVVQRRGNAERRRLCDRHAEDVKLGHGRALVALGDCFARGRGRRKSLLRARQLYEHAARHGSPAAHLRLGHLFRDGAIMRIDLRRAGEHFLIAARSGDPVAMMEYGLSLPRDRHSQVTACDWYARAARHGDADGIRLLADCFAGGIGRMRDAGRADVLYRRAAALGDPTAWFRLTGLALSGKGALMAEREGCNWAERAARRGNVAAQFAVIACRKGVQKFAVLK